MSEHHGLHRLPRLGLVVTIKCVGLFNEAQLQSNIVHISHLQYHPGVYHWFLELPQTQVFSNKVAFRSEGKMMRFIEAPKN